MIALFLVSTAIAPVNGKPSGGIVEFTDKASFVAALTNPTVIDFESLTPSGDVVGDEYAALGVLITHLDGQNINVLSAPPLSDDYRAAVFGSGTNVISSSYADFARPGYGPAPCCNVFFRDENSDNIRFTFPDGASAAGFFVGENDVNEVAIRVLDTEGNELLTRTFLGNTPYNVFFGVCSDTPIGSIELVEPAGELDGVVIDDLVFAPVADDPPPGGEDDEEPPAITVGDPVCLWPPNHKYHSFSVEDFVASVVDAVDPNVGIEDVVITSVSSDEAQDAPGTGDGNTLDDIVIAPDCRSVQLRAEREGTGDGRVYTIAFSVTDANGNTATATAEVRVPHDRRRNSCDAVLTPEGGYTVTSGCAPVTQ